MNSNIPTICTGYWLLGQSRSVHDVFGGFSIHKATRRRHLLDKKKRPI